MYYFPNTFIFGKVPGKTSLRLLQVLLLSIVQFWKTKQNKTKVLAWIINITLKYMVEFNNMRLSFTCS